VAAQVIGTSGTEQSQVLLIDKGSKDGIKPDMPVITPDGIVGKTRDVFRHTSQVLEISDSTSGAGVILEKTRIRGVLRGDTWGQPEIVNVSPDDRIQRGELVLTSGGDAIYPRGLAVGTVDRVRPDPEGTLVNVLVKPSANLAKLEEVLVITSTGEEMPSEMQQDLTEAQQAEQKASDVLAERLPSRVDPNLPADQQPPPEDDSADEGAARPVKPPAALHPDRYTPSDTPPATDLVPGQKITDGQSQATSGSENGAETPPKPPANPGSSAAPGTAAKPGNGKPATKPTNGTTAKPRPKRAAPGVQTAPGSRPPAGQPTQAQPPAANPASNPPSPTTPQSPQGGRAWL
jgi:rod shape-determining protein MreC